MTRLLLFFLLVPVTAAAQSVDAPEWAKEAVWYQIFPERFRNGDPSNDPTPDEIRGSWPHFIPAGWRVADWTADWYAQADWERATGRDFYVTNQLRRYGGDLQGILDRLDYLDSLGVTALYLNPMFESPSLHKYDGALFHHIDNNFGPDPASDRAAWARENPLDPATWGWTSADRLFLTLVAEAHARGMKVILDGVFNHMGLRSFAFEDLARNQQRSAYRDWFTVKAWDDPATPDNEFDYEGWVGVKDLPELREDEHGLVPPVRAYVFASVRRWMDPNADGDPSDGIDGWRLDVAEMVHLRFWKDFKTFVRSINPEAYTVGEVWWQDWPNFGMFNARPWLEGDAFDAVMNYRWGSATRKLFLGADLPPGQPYGPTDFFTELARLHTDYPPEVNYVVMNTLGSHDTDRPASQVVNPKTLFDHRVSPKDDPAYDIRKPNTAEWQTFRLMLAHQFTTVGAPHLFYGDEAGMWGGDDPDERKPMVWPEMTFADEATHPLGLPRPRDPVAFDHDLFAWYRTLAHLRQAHPALQRGTFTPILADDARRMLAYERAFGDDRVWVAFNLGATAYTVTLPITTQVPGAGHTPGQNLAGRTVRDALSGDTAVLGEGSLTFTLSPRSARIWVLPSGQD
jgi:glycosidase